MIIPLPYTFEDPPPTTCPPECASNSPVKRTNSMVCYSLTVSRVSLCESCPRTRQSSVCPTHFSVFRQDFWMWPSLLVPPVLYTHCVSMHCWPPSPPVSLCSNLSVPFVMGNNVFNRSSKFIFLRSDLRLFANSVEQMLPSSRLEVNKISLNVELEIGVYK